MSDIERKKEADGRSSLTFSYPRELTKGMADAADVVAEEEHSHRWEFGPGWKRCRLCGEAIHTGK